VTELQMHWPDLVEWSKEHNLLAKRLYVVGTQFHGAPVDAQRRDVQRPLFYSGGRPEVI
jgi:hypothetical protein